MKAAALLMACLAGCAEPWPIEGRGGMAERREPADAALVQAGGDLVRLSEEHTAPGRLSMASELYVRARREHDAGLFQDAENSLADAARLAGLYSPASGFPKRPACAVRPCR